MPNALKSRDWRANSFWVNLPFPSSNYELVDDVMLIVWVFSDTFDLATPRLCFSDKYLAVDAPVRGKRQAKIRRAG